VRKNDTSVSARGRLPAGGFRGGGGAAVLMMRVTGDDEPQHVLMFKNSSIRVLGTFEDQS
jgi:hypothetical protein